MEDPSPSALAPQPPLLVALLSPFPHTGMCKSSFQIKTGCFSSESADLGACLSSRLGTRPELGNRMPRVLLSVSSLLTHK